MLPNQQNIGFQQPLGAFPAAPQSGPSRDLTHMDLSTHLAGVTSQGTVNVQFFYSRIRTQSKNAYTSGRTETRLCVAKQPRGDRHTIAHRYITEAQAQRDHPQEFAYFKNYQDVPTTGTQLYEIPGISQSQIALLVLNGIRSVEDLLSVPVEALSAQVGMDAVSAYKVASAWQDRRKSAAPTIAIAEVEARFEAQLKAMADQMAAMQATNQSLMMQIEARAALTQPQAQSAPAMEVGSRDGFTGDLPDMEVSTAEMITGNGDLALGDPLADD